MYSHHDVNSASRSFGENVQHVNVGGGAFEASRSAHDKEGREDYLEEARAPLKEAPKIQIIQSTSKDQLPRAKPARGEQGQPDRQTVTLEKVKSLEEIPPSIKNNPYLLPYPFVRSQSDTQFLKEIKGLESQYGASDVRNAQIIDFNK